MAVTGVTDPDAGDVITVTITTVTQDEGTKASDTTVSGTWACPDAKSISGPSVSLAAETLKATTGNGRVYKIAFKATDKAGAVCTGAVTVCAKTGTSGSCKDDGQKYASTVCV